jgi:hypothetical protein
MINERRWKNELTDSPACAGCWVIRCYSIVSLLAQPRDRTPSQIARGVGRSVSRVSHVLAALRMLEVVRYETNWKQSSYRLKYPRQTRQIIAALENFIDSTPPLK